MRREFKLGKDPCGYGFNLYRNSAITIKTGLTVLVGCNGIGKSTLLHCIRDSLKREHIPYLDFDNLLEGGNFARQESLNKCDFGLLAAATFASEGENIMLNITNLATLIGKFVRTGIYQNDVNRLASAFTKALGHKNDNVAIVSNERWILFDVVDSGLSVDNIVELKEQLFSTIFQYSFGNEIYIIISANEYEMASGEQCFDVYNGEYITFNDYEDYRNMILESKKWKEERNSNK